MDFDLTPEQKMIRDTVREFAEAEIAPHAAEWDRTEHFPIEVFRKMGELGFLGLPIPEEYGGAGADMISYCLAVEEIGRACGGTGLSYEAHVSLACTPILLYGTEEQKRKYLVPMARGEALGAFGLTEPGAGSDAGGTRTTAVLDGDEWVITGNKNLQHQRWLREVRRAYRAHRFRVARHQRVHRADGCRGLLREQTV